MSEKYEFNLSDPSTWTRFPKPELSPNFVDGLKRINRAARDAGLVKGSRDLFRVIWGCEEEVFIEGDTFVESGHYLKYQLCSTQKLKGFKYQDAKDVWHFVDRPDQIPAMNYAALPVYTMEQVGEPRWIIEQWRSAGDFNGVFETSGYYFLRRIQQDDEPENPDTLMKPYRDPDKRDLVILAGVLYQMQHVSEQERKTAIERDKSFASAAKAKAKTERVEELGEAIIQGIKDAPKNIPFSASPGDLKGLPLKIDTLRKQLRRDAEQQN